jgi:integrase
MCSLHKDSRGKTPYWIGAYTDRYGRQIKRSTKTTDKHTARVIVEGWERAETLARRGSLTEQTARTILNEILERAGQEKIYVPTAKEYMDDWLKRETSPTSETAINSKQRLVARLFLESLNARANIPLSHIVENDILALRDKMVAEGRSPATANGLVRGVLGSAFRYALNRGWIPVNPVACIKKPSRTRKAEKGTFSPEQVSRLVAAADVPWRGVILFGYFTGQRLSDIANLKWSNVDLQTDIPLLRLEQKKTGATVILPLRDELTEYLLGLPSTDTPDGPIFPPLAGLGTGGTRGLSTLFTGVMTRAGIRSATLRERGVGVSRSVAALSFHSLRHSCNSALANAGVSQELRMKVTGHASKTMNNVYSHMELETIRTALNQLPKLT